MTRKDYVSVAESLAKCAGGLGQENLLYVADMIATDIKRENPAFDYDTFMFNSGVTLETLENAKV